MPVPMRYRPEIDGLRAVAIIPVLLFHAGFAGFSGGFIGVDVFFVISGYLVTGIIFAEIQAGRYSVWGFYERRARRILPALFTMTLACLPFAWMWMLPDDFRRFSASLLSVLGFASNFFFLSESGYFDISSELKPLLHTWSLAVEEQFYIVLPLLFWLLRKWPTRSIANLIIGLSVSSLVLAHLWSTSFPEANFYLLPTRFWELGAGTIIALTRYGEQPNKGPFAELMGLLGLAMIAASVAFLSESNGLPGFLSLLPVLGTCLIIVFANGSTLAGQLLSHRPIVFIGLISYSLYLWHQPLFAFARLRLFEGAGEWVSIAILFAVFPLSYVSWRWIETPFRRRGRGFSRSQITSAVAAPLILIGFGTIGVASDGAPWRLAPAVVALAGWSKDKNPIGDACNSARRRFITPDKACDYGTTPPYTVALLGDSHANRLAPVLAKKLGALGIGMKQMTYGGCVPAPGYYRSDRTDSCSEFNEMVRNYIMSNPDIQIVVMNARWTQKLLGTEYYGNSPQPARAETSYAIPIGKPATYATSPDRIPDIGKIYRNAIQAYLDAGKKVALVYPEPEAGWDVPTYAAKLELFNVAGRRPISTGFDAFQKRNRAAYEQLDMISDQPALLRVYPAEIFCNIGAMERCMSELDGKPLYFDDDHFTSIGAEMMAQKIAGEMSKRGWISDQPTH